MVSIAARVDKQVKIGRPATLDDLIGIIDESIGVIIRGWHLHNDAAANIYSTAVPEAATKTGAATPCLPTDNTG